MSDDDKYIEMDICDSIMERPIVFSINDESFFIYHACLGKIYLLHRIISSLNINQEVISKNPYLEAMRLCKINPKEVCRIISYFTFKNKDDIFDTRKVDKRTDMFLKNLSIDEMSTLLVTILTLDNTDLFIKHLGIDKDLDERKRISSVKKYSGYFSFGGKSPYGTLIDFACHRYGWSMDYVILVISYTNLRMLMVDTISSVHLSKEEMRQLGMKDNIEIIDAGDPKNRKFIEMLLNED